MSEGRALILINSYKEQHDSPFAESNKIFAISILVSGVFYLEFFGVSFDLKIFEMDLFEIPNALFALPIISLLALSYAAVRAADAAYYQKLIEIIAEECLEDRVRVVARGAFGGGAISSNFLDIWREVPNRNFRIWFMAMFAAVGGTLSLTVLLPYATGITYIFWVNSEKYVGPFNFEMMFVVIAECIAIASGIHALIANSLSVTE